MGIDRLYNLVGSEVDDTDSSICAANCLNRKQILPQNDVLIEGRPHDRCNRDARGKQVAEYLNRLSD